MWKLSGTRAQMAGQIALHADSPEVRIMAKPSKKIFFMLLQNTRVKRIVLSRGVAKTVPGSIFSGLAQAGVEADIISARRGRPERIGKERKEGALKAVAKGMPLASALEKFGMSRRSYFYAKKERKK